MRMIEDLIGENAALGRLSPDHREVISGCAGNRVYAPGEYLIILGRRK